MATRDRQRYSASARRAIDGARHFAAEHGYTTIDSCHLLIGILREESSVGCTVLHGLGLDRAGAERAWARLPVLRSDTATAAAEPDLSPGLQEALQLASEEARWLGHSYIGTEHLSLGIARTAEERLTLLLTDVGIPLEYIRRDVRRLLRTGVTEISVEQARRMAHLSELSRRVLNGAEQIAEQMNHKQVGLAHLLLVLAREQRSICNQVLHTAGLDERALEADLRKARPASGGDLEDLLDRAVEQGEALGSHHTSTDHILLALALAPRGARLLRKYGALPAVVQRQLQERLQN